MKKKIGAILMAGVMACTMATGLALTTGCGSKKKADFEMPEGGFDTSKEVTITFYHTMGQDLQKVLDTYIEEFNVLYPNIKVEHDQIGTYNDVRDQISKEILANNQPNLAYCYPDHVAVYNRAGAVQPLNDFLSDGTYKDYKVKQVQVDENGEAVYDQDGNFVMEDVNLALTETEKNNFLQRYYNEGYKFGDESKMYTLPFSKSTEVMYYNKTFFDAHPEIKLPTTWDEMEEACRQIKEIDPASTPLGYDSEANWFITMCAQYGSGYTSATGNKYLFNNQTNKDFVQKFKGWYDKGYVTTQEIYGSYTSGLFTATTGQRCYMCIGSSAGAKNQVPPATDSSYLFDAGITSIPQVNKDNPQVISQGPSVCILKNDDPQKVLASWLLLKFLTTSVNFQAEFSAVSGYMPVLTEEVMETNAVYSQKLEKARTDRETNPNPNLTMISVLVGVEQGDAAYVSPAFVGSTKARDEVGTLLQAVFMGTKTLDQAFSDAIDECEYYAS